MTDRTDNFNRTDSSSSVQSPSDGGSNWVINSGTWGIVSNTGYSVGGGSQESMYLESSVQNVTVQVTLSVAPIDAGIIVRATDDLNYLLCVTNASGMRIYKREAGGFSLLATTDFSWANGDVLKVTVDSANLITAYQNGVSKTSATSAFNATATKHGLRSHTDTTVRFDNFSITGAAGGLFGRSVMLNQAVNRASTY